MQSFQALPTMIVEGEGVDVDLPDGTDCLVSIWDVLSLGSRKEDEILVQALHECGLTAEILACLTADVAEGDVDHKARCSETLKRMCTDAITVMAVAQPLRVVIANYEEELDVVAAKYADTPAKGLFHLRLPKEILIEAAGVQKDVLPVKLLLENAIWLQIDRIDEDGVAHATLDNDFPSNLNPSVCWTPAQSQAIAMPSIEHLLIDGSRRSTNSWLGMLSSLPQQSVCVYPSIGDALDRRSSGFLLLQKVGLVYAFQKDDSHSLLLLSKLEVVEHVSVKSDLDEIVQRTFYTQSATPPPVEQQPAACDEDASTEEQKHDIVEEHEEGHEVSDADLVDEPPPSTPAAPTPAQPAVPDSASLLSPNEEVEGMTMAQRRELKKRREEDEKKKRLQDFLQTTSPVAKLDTEEGEGRKAGKVKDRFEQAKRIQQQEEEERLNRIRNDTTRKLVYSTSSRWNNNDPASAVASTPMKSPQSMERRSSKSMRNLWEGVINESKNTEQNRFREAKQSTISQFRQTEGTGIVKKRVGEWEELFVQIAATAEQLNEFLAAAQELTMRLEQVNIGGSAEDRLAAQERFREGCSIPEDFVINDTHIYSSGDLDHVIHSYLKKLLVDAKANYVPLSCGVYGETAAKPPIEVFAAAIKTQDGKIYVSVTVKAAADKKELDVSIYGVRKIVVVGKDLNQKIFEKLLNVVPEPWMIASLPDYVPISYGNPVEAETEVLATETEAEDKDETTHEVTHDLQEIMDSMDVPAASALVGEPSIEEVVADEMVQEADEHAIVTEEKHLDSAPVEVKEEIDAVEVVEKAAIEEVAPSEEPQVEGGAVEEVAPSEVPETLVPEVVEVEAAPALPDQLAAEPVSEQTTIKAVNSTPQPIAIEKWRSERRGSRRRSGSGGSAGSAEDEGEGTWVSNPTPPRDRSPSEEEEDPLDAELRHAQEEDGSATTAPMSLFHSDNEDDDTDIDAEDDDDDGQPNHFGRAISLANVTVPRCFAPSSGNKNAFSKSVHTVHKFSWQVEEEMDEGLPMVDHSSLTVDLSQFTTSHCCSNLFTLRGGQYTLMFTGTLKHAGVESQYIVEGDKLFEWIHGAAASGWMIKWPMRSQSFGRVRKRFFVLRDNLLSYSATKPQNEEEIQSTFSRNTLHLTDNTTVGVGRKFLTRCLVITTPIDTLWIRMKRDFSSEATKWMSELNKAIQYQQRQKYFMTKPRIESKWYHESPQFSLRNVDAVVSDNGYVKTALFRLAGADEAPANCLYSIDINSSEVPRCQLEIVNDEESTSLPSDLSVLKIYGGLVILGGSNGFLGIGLISRTANKDATGATRPTEFLAPGSKRESITMLSEPTVAPSAAGAAGSVRKVMFCWPCQSSAEGKEDSQSSLSRSLSDESIPIYPHSAANANYITALAEAKVSPVFAAADSDGVVSIWQLPRSKYLQTLNPHSVLSNRSMHTIMKRLRPRLIGVINVNNLSHDQGQVFDKPSSKRSENAPEKVMKMQFVANDSYLIISTQRRLLLVTLHTQQEADYLRGMSISEMRGVSFAEGYEHHPEELMPKALRHQVLGFNNWVEMDRALPSLNAVFDIYVNENSSSMKAHPDRNVLSSLGNTARNSRHSFGAPLLGMDLHSAPTALPHAGMSFIEWRVVENDEPSVSAFSGLFGKKDGNAAKRCTVSRIVWTEVMITAAVERAKPCI